MNKKSAILLIICFSVILSFPWIGSRAFYTRGEPREALVPQKMIESSNWILPRTFDDRVPSKPPFSHWLIGLSAHLRGLFTAEVVVDEWSSRLPSAVLALLFTVVFFYWIEKTLGVERAFHSCCILLTSFEWMRGLVTTRVDTILSVLLGFGIVSLYALAEKRTFVGVISAILALAAATLTKGPVALVLPGAILALYLFCEKRKIARTIQIGVQVFVPALLIATFWYFLAYQEAGDDFLSKFWYENVQRFASSTDDNPHNHSVFYLAIMFLVGLIPWSFLYFPALRSCWDKRRTPRLIKDWFSSIEPIERYALIVVVVFFVFFSIPSSKRGVYLLPSFPFAALLLSRITTREQFLSSFNVRLILRLIAVVVAVVIFSSVALITVLPLSLVKNELLADLLSFEQNIFRSNLLAWLVTLLALGCLRWLYKALKTERALFVPLLSTLVAVLVFFQGPVVNGFAAAVSEQRLTEQLKKFSPQIPLFSYRNEYYGTIFKLQRSVSIVGWQSAPAGIILVKERDYERFKSELGDSFNQRIIDRSQGSVLRYGNRVLIIEFSSLETSALPLS